jgi:hypothetical protein
LTNGGAKAAGDKLMGRDLHSFHSHVWSVKRDRHQSDEARRQILSLVIHARAPGAFPRGVNGSLVSTRSQRW